MVWTLHECGLGDAVWFPSLAPALHPHRKWCAQKTAQMPTPSLYQDGGKTPQKNSCIPKKVRFPCSNLQRLRPSMRQTWSRIHQGLYLGSSCGRVAQKSSLPLDAHPTHSLLLLLCYIRSDNSGRRWLIALDAQRHKLAHLALVFFILGILLPGDPFSEDRGRGEYR